MAELDQRIVPPLEQALQAVKELRTGAELLGRRLDELREWCCRMPTLDGLDELIEPDEMRAERRAHINVSTRAHLARLRSLGPNATKEDMQAAVADRVRDLANLSPAQVRGLRNELLAAKTRGERLPIGDLAEAVAATKASVERLASLLPRTAVLSTIDAVDEMLRRSSAREEIAAGLRIDTSALDKRRARRK